MSSVRKIFEFYISSNGTKTYNKQEKSNRYNDIVFNKEYMHDGHDMYEVFSRISNFFKDANFYDFSNPGYVQLSSRERQEIIYSSCSIGAGINSSFGTISDS